jgi:alpha-mannosidase
MILFPTQAETAQQSFFQVSNPAVILDTVKKAEETDEIVIRFYESRGTQSDAQVFTSLPVLSAQPCNLLEDEQGAPIDWPSEGLSLRLKPFEIASYKLKLKK